MDNNLLIILFIIHLAGDYYIQNDGLSEKKKEKVRYIFLHCAYILAFATIMLIPFWRTNIIYYVLAFVLSHLVIDILKFVVGKKIESNENSGKLYIVDQILRLLLIVIISSLYNLNEVAMNQWSIFLWSGKIPNNILRYVLLIMAILKPTNITFRELFGHIKPIEDVSTEDTKKVGKLIGNMERLLVCVFLSLNQYTAIGLVFTAKSITRYNKISDKQEFAEYYLLGTLFSILVTVVLFVAIVKY